MGPEVGVALSSDLAPVVTHPFSLDDVAEAFEVASSKSGGAIKVVVNV